MTHIRNKQHPLRDNLFLRRTYNFICSQFPIFFGLPGFFKPRIINPSLINHAPLELASFYDTSELRETLKQFIDFKRINSNEIRLSLGAVQLDTGELVHFDNTKQTITADHVMASCALPPGFPAIKLNNKFYWDGGISDNTPLNMLIEEVTCHKLLCFMLNLFTPSNLNPTAGLDDILRIQKEIIYSSHHEETIRNRCLVQDLRYAIHCLAKKIPRNKLDPETKTLIKKGKPLLMNIVCFHYHGQPTDLSSKDYNFSSQSIAEHRQAGIQDVENALKDTSWLFHQKNDTGIVLRKL